MENTDKTSNLAIKPTLGYVLVTPNKDKETQTSSGIYITVTNEEKVKEGRVVKVGEAIYINEGVKYIPVQEKQNILYTDFIKYKEYHLVHFSNIIATYDN